MFVDDSNLWIAGMKVQGKKLKDTDIDTRYRIDLGKFLNLVTEERHISKAFLYGSVPPPNDTVWKAAREKNFEVKTFQRSGSGREKELDVAMGSDITETLFTLPYTEGVIFVTVTGDRDLKSPIEKVLKQRIQVELWSWEDAMAREFRHLATLDRLFTPHTLDKVEQSFGYTTIMSTREKKDIDPAHAIAYKDVPKGKQFLHEVVAHINRLLRLFYITSVKSQTEGKRDLIVEFPKSKPELVLSLIRKLAGFEYQPCSYVEYKHQLQQQNYEIETKNRFEILSKLDDSSIDTDSLLDVVESSMSLELNDVTPEEEEEPIESSAAAGSDPDDWLTVVRREAGKRTLKKKRSEMQCRWGDHCSKASECPCKHTKEEKQAFARWPKIPFKFLKTRECNKLDKHVTTEQQKRCSFAHVPSDSWCLKCRIYGHLTNDCTI